MDELKLSKVESKGYGVIYKLPMQDKDLDVVAKAFYAYICSYAGAGDTAFPGMDRICDDLGLSRQRLERHRKVLVEKGYITINQIKEKGKFARNEYRINKEIQPMLQNTTTVIATTEKPTTENVTINNNSSNNNSINNNNNNIKDNVQSAIERDFDEFWKFYPNKKAKKTALVSYTKIIKAGKYNHEHIMNGLMLYLDYIKATNTQSSFIAHPTTYLNQERFNDELVIPTNQNNSYQQQKTFRFGEIAQEQNNRWGIE